MIFVRLNYLSFTLSGCKDKGLENFILWQKLESSTYTFFLLQTLIDWKTPNKKVLNGF